MTDEKNVISIKTPEDQVSYAKLIAAREIPAAVREYVALRTELAAKLAQADEWLASGINPLDIEPTMVLTQLASSMDAALSRVRGADAVARVYMSKKHRGDLIAKAAVSLKTEIES